MMKTAIIYDKWLSGMGGGEVVACNMATILRDNGYSVIFVSNENVSLEVIKNKLDIDMKGIKFVNQLPATIKKQPDLFINTSFMDYSYGFAKKNIYYIHFPSKIRSGLFNYILCFFQKTGLHSLFPKLLKERVNDRLRAGIFIDMKKRLDSYDTFITHSKYVAGWTKKYWRKTAQVLYPPVSLLHLRGDRNHRRGDKNNWICFIGRFFTLGHGKKQDVMVEAFKKLITNNQQLIINNWQLHLVGGVGNEPSSFRFIKQLQEQVKGYPIYFHFNSNRKEVEEILLKSKIYWHAAGYGEDQEKDPIKFEHFGIAPIEAISAGCIPLLYDGGGLTEIIEILDLPKDEYLFKTVDELVGKTLALIKSDKKSVPQSIQQQVIKSFSKEHFNIEFIKIIAL